MKTYTSKQKRALIRAGICFTVATSDPQVFLMHSARVCEFVRVLP